MKHHESPLEFRRRPPGEQAFLLAADLWDWDRQNQANKKNADLIRQNQAVAKARK